MKKLAQNKNKAKLVKLSAALFSALMTHSAGLRAATLTCPISLFFGEFSQTCAGTGKATVTPGNTQSVSGCITSTGAPYQRAQCNVNQDISAITNFQISVTAASYLISNGTKKMTVDNFSCRFQGSSTSTGPCVKTTSGFFLLMDIGATLNVNTSQAAGSYTGTFTVNTNFP